MSESPSLFTDGQRDAIRVISNLMYDAQKPLHEMHPDTLIPYGNGYSTWFIGPERYVNGQLLGTAPLTEDELLERVQRFAGDETSE